MIQFEAPCDALCTGAERSAALLKLLWCLPTGRRALPCTCLIMDPASAEAADVSLPAVAWAYIRTGLRDQDLSSLRLANRSLRQDVGQLVRKVELDVVDASVPRGSDEPLAQSSHLRSSLPDLAAAAAAYPDVRQLTLRQCRASTDGGEVPLTASCQAQGWSSSSSSSSSRLTTTTASSSNSSIDSLHSASSSCASSQGTPGMSSGAHGTKPVTASTHPSSSSSRSRRATSVCGSCASASCSPEDGCVCWAQELLEQFPLLSEVSVVGSSRITPLDFPYNGCSCVITSVDSSDSSNSFSYNNRRGGSSSSTSTSSSNDTMDPATEDAPWSQPPHAEQSSTALQLQRLSLTRCHLRTTLRQLQGLTQLSVTRCHYTPAVAHDLWSSLGELPGLAHLVLEAPQQVVTAPPCQPLPSPPSPAAAAAAGHMAWQTLHTLELHLTSSSGTGPWNILGAFTALRALSVDVTRAAEEGSASTCHVLRALQPLTALTQLHLSGLQDAASSCMVHLTTFRRLQRLHLQPSMCGSHSAPQLTEDTLRPLTTALPGLTDLELPSCSVTLAAFSHFKGWEQLTQLQLSDSHLDDTALAAASDALKRLVSLNVAGCRLVSDLGLTIIAHSCRRLTKLDLSRCSYFVTGAGVLRLTSLTTLTWLSLEYCDRVTGDAMASLAAARLPLRHLNVSSCQGMTDAAVAAVADNLLQLQELQLNYCHQVTNRGVRQLARLPQLTSLHLVGTLYQRTPAMERLHAQLTRVVYCPDTEVTLRSFW